MEKQLKVIAIGISIIASYYAIKIVANTIGDVKHEVKKLAGKVKEKVKEAEGKQNENIMGFHI